MREVPFGNDGDYSRNNLILRLNSELVNNIGNLIQRCTTMIYKNCDGKIPISIEHSKTHIESFIENYFQAFDNLAFDKALQAIIDYADLVNKRFNDKAPWSLFKNGRIDEMHICLHETAEAIRLITILLKPFLPNLTSKISDLLNMPKNMNVMFTYLNQDLIIFLMTIQNLVYVYENMK
jgi:methionyl-tRNA synthetase